MQSSALQRYILIATLRNGPKCNRSVFESFYREASEQDAKVITVSIERLIAKGLLKGYGYKTAEKLFIDKVSLTSTGAKLARKMHEDRQRLPLSRKSGGRDPKR